MTRTIPYFNYCLKRYYIVLVTVSVCLNIIKMYQCLEMLLYGMQSSYTNRATRLTLKVFG